MDGLKYSKEIRDRLGRSQWDIAGLAGISQSRLAQIEMGKRNCPEVLNQKLLAAIREVAIEQLTLAKMILGDKMAEYREAKAEKRSYKKLQAIHIEKGANGGHSVIHHYRDGDGMTMPKAHHFGPEDGADGTTHAHVVEHMAKMGIMPGEAHAEEHAGPETVEQAASEPASEPASEDVNA